MKDKILKDFEEQLNIAMSASLETGLDIYEFQKEFLLKALDEYADWKIKECLDIAIKYQVSTIPELLGKVLIDKDDLDQILTNKDKIK